MNDKVSLTNDVFGIAAGEKKHVSSLKLEFPTS